MLGVNLSDLAFVGCAGVWQRALRLSALGDEDLFCACRVPRPVVGAAMNTNNPQLKKAPVCSVPLLWLPAVSGGSRLLRS